MRSRRRLDELLANLPANVPPQLMALKFSPALRERVRKRVAQLMYDQTVKAAFPVKKKRCRVLIAVAIAGLFFAVVGPRWYLFSRSGSLPASQPTSRNLEVEKVAWFEEPLKQTMFRTPPYYVPLESGKDTVVIPLEVLPLPHGKGALIRIVYQHKDKQHYCYLLLHFKQGRAQPASFVQSVTSTGISTSN